MKTAIITGASSGLGREFARQLTDIFPEIECCWLIARREDRLEEIAREMVGVETVCLPLDLCDSMSFTTLQEKLAAEKPEVAILINNAGCGYLGRMGETETAVQTRMVDLNVRAMTAMTNLVIPYMPAGGTHPQHVFHRILLPHAPDDGVRRQQGVCVLLHCGPQ